MLDGVTVGVEQGGVPVADGLVSFGIRDTAYGYSASIPPLPTGHHKFQKNQSSPTSSAPASLFALLFFVGSGLGTARHDGTIPTDKI